MPRIKLIADDGWVAMDERVSEQDFGSERFCRQLAERLTWATADAERAHTNDRRPARLRAGRFAREQEREPVAVP